MSEDQSVLRQDLFECRDVGMMAGDDHDAATRDRPAFQCGNIDNRFPPAFAEDVEPHALRSREYVNGRSGRNRATALCLLDTLDGIIVVRWIVMEQC